eukprot:gene3901-25822_t
MAKQRTAPNVAVVQQVYPRDRYGFAAYVFATMATVSLLVWAFFPETCSKLLDLELPNRYWAVAVPMWFCVTWGCAFFFLLSLIFLLTPGTEDASNVVDSTNASQTGWGLAPRKLKERPGQLPRLIGVIRDIPVSEVSAQLYLDADTDRDTKED